MLQNKDSTTNIFKGRYAFWRMVYILIFALLLGVMGFTYYFIYQNIYSTIANTHIITALKTSVNIYNLDIAGFQKAAGAIEKKQKIEYLPATARNIFNYSSAPAAPSSTPVTTSTYANSSTQP